MFNFITRNDSNDNIATPTFRVTPSENHVESVGLDSLSVHVEKSPIQETEDTEATNTVGFSASTHLPPAKFNEARFGISPLEEERSMLPKPVDENAHLNKPSYYTKTTGGKKVNNWFTQMIDRKGEEYFTANKVTVDEVSRNAERILNEIIGGRIDYEKFGQYIIKPVILGTLVNYCSNKLAINRAIQFTLGYTYNDYVNRMSLQYDPSRLAALSVIDDSLSRNITQAISIVNQDIAIYGILYNKLSIVESTGNASVLFGITNELNALRKNVRNNRY